MLRKNVEKLYNAPKGFKTEAVGKRMCVYVAEYGSQQQFNLIKDPQRNDFISG